MKAVGLVVSERKHFYVYFFSIVSLWELMTPGVGSFVTPGIRLVGCRKLGPLSIATQKICGFEFFMCFP